MILIISIALIFLVLIFCTIAFVFSALMFSPISLAFYFQLFEYFRNNSFRFSLNVCRPLMVLTALICEILWI